MENNLVSTYFVGAENAIMTWKCSTLPAALRSSLQWRQNGRDSVSNHQPHDCLLNGLFTGAGEFPAQMASNAEMFAFDDVIMSRFEVIIS